MSLTIIPARVAIWVIGPWAPILYWPWVYHFVLACFPILRYSLGEESSSARIHAAFFCQAHKMVCCWLISIITFIVFLAKEGGFTGILRDAIYASQRLGPWNGYESDNTCRYTAFSNTFLWNGATKTLGDKLVCSNCVFANWRMYKKLTFCLRLQNVLTAFWIRTGMLLLSTSLVRTSG